jgi:tyrosine-specific transport protein
MKPRLIGGILLIVGNCIGGGMLALPIVTAQAGFIGASTLILGAWMAMTLGAFFILEVNLWMPPNSNIVSMAKATLGRGGHVVTWITYLLLLYSLLAAYISGGTDIFNSLMQLTGFNLPTWVISLIFLSVLGLVVYLGIESVDYVNRGLMIVKFLTLFLLIHLVFSHIHYQALTQLHPHYLISAVTVVITSFAFAVVPSLRSYFDSDVKKLRLAILIGSLIPLCCYLLWVAVVLGRLPWQGEHGLLAISQSDHAVSILTESIVEFSHNQWVTTIVRIFTSLCVTTSFLAVALSLSDFLADGLSLQKKGQGKIVIFICTFIPPLVIVLFYPSIFMNALSYAGTFCAILLLLIPALMVWKGRYLLNIESSYQVMGGKLTLLFTLIIAIFVIGQELVANLHLF